MREQLASTRNIILLAFMLGILASIAAYFLLYPPAPLFQTSAVVNVDALGNNFTQRVDYIQNLRFVSQTDGVIVAASEASGIAPQDITEGFTLRRAGNSALAEAIFEASEPTAGASVSLIQTVIGTSAATLDEPRRQAAQTLVDDLRAELETIRQQHVEASAAVDAFVVKNGYVQPDRQLAILQGELARLRVEHAAVDYRDVRARLALDGAIARLESIVPRVYAQAESFAALQSERESLDRDLQSAQRSLDEASGELDRPDVVPQITVQAVDSEIDRTNRLRAGVVGAGLITVVLALLAMLWLRTVLGHRNRPGSGHKPAGRQRDALAFRSGTRAP